MKELETKEIERGVCAHWGPTATPKRCLGVTPGGSIDFSGIHVPDPDFSFYRFFFFNLFNSRSKSVVHVAFAFSVFLLLLFFGVFGGVGFFV